MKNYTDCSAKKNYLMYIMYKILNCYYFETSSVNKTRILNKGTHCLKKKNEQRNPLKTEKHQIATSDWEPKKIQLGTNETFTTECKIGRLYQGHDHRWRAEAYAWARR